jgi:hypothetical protein
MKKEGLMPVIIASVVRHLLTLAAGSLLTIGISEADTENLTQVLEPVVSGAVLYGIGQLWSIKEKRSR